MRGEVRIVGTERPGGLELRSEGLAAAGLPEVRAAGLPPYLGLGWARVLGEVAQRVAAAGPPLPVELDLGRDGVPAPVRLLLEKGGTLGVTMPLPSDGSPPGNVDAWRRALVERLYPEAGI